jgi:hypothetical protein
MGFLMNAQTMFAGFQGGEDSLGKEQWKEVSRHGFT